MDQLIEIAWGQAAAQTGISWDDYRTPSKCLRLRIYSSSQAASYSRSPKIFLDTAEICTRAPIPNQNLRKKHAFLNSKQFTEHYLPAPRLPWRFWGKESTCQCSWRGFDPWVEKISWRRKWQPTPAFLPGKFRGNGQRRLARVRHNLVTTTWRGRGLALTELNRQQANTLTGKTPSGQAVKQDRSGWGTQEFQHVCPLGQPM